MESYVVPETPDQRPARRRSSRRSTMLSSIATDSLMRKVTGTPMSQDSVTFVSESPAVNLSRSGGSRRKSVSLRAAQIGISECAGNSSKKKAIHPVFVMPNTTNEIEGNTSPDEPFEMFVPATQDLHNLSAVGKVQAWLNSEEPSPCLRRKRKSNIQDVSKYMTGERGERSRDSAAEEDKEHVPYRPPSFQDYSSDSAKAMLAQFEAKSISKPADEDKSNFDTTLELLPKAAEENPIDKVLEGVTAFVEVRSKNENRSDVVVGQLLALGASVVPRLNNRCTHVVFKEGSLSTYNKAKKLNLHIVSVNWIEACKKQHSKPEEHLFPPMNQEKYDSPGLFPKLRKTKSLQPKSDEEFSKLMDAKAKRIMKKKLAATEMPEKSSISPIPNTPKCSPKVPKRRRSQILDTLKEYEEMEKNSPVAAATTPKLPATPVSPCSSEDLDTPLLKKIAKRLFKAQQEAGPDCTTPDSYSPKNARANSPIKITRASPSKLSQSPERKVPKEMRRSIEIPKDKVKSSSAKKKSTPKVNPDPPLSRTRRKKLFTQTSILSQTPLDTPQMTMTVPIKEPKTRGGKKQKTKLVKKNSFYVAEQQQNIFKQAEVASLPTFKKPSKRIVRSMQIHRRSSMDFIKPLPSTAEKKCLKKQQKRELVLTSCNSDDHKMVKDVIKRLAGQTAVRVTSQVLPSTTHVICGNNEGRRTLNMLRAILCGCWIVSLDWVYQCLGQGTWVDEESYEMVSFSAAVKQRRLERDLLPQSNLFKDLDLPMYVGRHCRVPKKELVELIQMAGGKCVNQLRTAKIILAHDSSCIQDQDQLSVMENWLLDSIQQHCVLPLDEYLIIQN